MKKPAFVVKKWLVRAVVAVGATVGLSSCYQQGNLYGPPPSDDSIQVNDSTKTSDNVNAETSPEVADEENGDEKTESCGYGYHALFDLCIVLIMV